MQNARRRSPQHRNSVRILFAHNGVSYASITTGETATVRIARRGCLLIFNAGPRQTSTLPRESPHQSSPEVVNNRHTAFQSPRGCVQYRSLQIQRRSAQMSISLGDRSLQWIHWSPSTARSTKEWSRPTYNRKRGSNKRMSLLVTANIFISESPESLDQIPPVQLNFTENHQNYMLHQTTSNILRFQSSYYD